MRAPADARTFWASLATFIISLIAVLLIEAMAARVTGSAVGFPNLVLITLFIWSIRRPWYLSPPVLLLIGIAHDLVSAHPMGVWALGYLAGFALARDREADGLGADLAPMLARFTVLTVIVMGAAYAAGSFAVGAPAPVGGLILEAVLTIVVFACVGWVFARRRERSSFF